MTGGGAALAVLLAPDPELPMRDELLSPTADGVEVVRCKYRVGESLRVLYRTEGRLLTVRVAAGGRPQWWTFPDDRRLTDIAGLMAAAPPWRDLLGGRSWVHSEVAEYAPERSLTVRAVGGDGAVRGYVKTYAPGSRDIAALSRRYAWVAERVDAPAPIGWRTDALALTALPGCRAIDVADHDAAALAARFGAAIATVHASPPPPGTPRFGRFGAERLDGSVAAVAAARPDVAGALASVRDRLSLSRPATGHALLHGDCHPKNALVDGCRVALIDLDQAGIGDPAADVGSHLARLRVTTIVGMRSAAAEAEQTAAFLAGYESVRPPPTERSVHWHVAAALIAEQAVRAVNRVRPDVLARLDEVVDAAVEVVP
jgi:aminoglycoside phosphotransferase